MHCRQKPQRRHAIDIDYEVTYSNSNSNSYSFNSSKNDDELLFQMDDLEISDSTAKQQQQYQLQQHFIRENKSRSDSMSIVQALEFTDEEYSCGLSF